MVNPADVAGLTPKERQEVLERLDPEACDRLLSYELFADASRPRDFDAPAALADLQQATIEYARKALAHDAPAEIWTSPQDSPGCWSDAKTVLLFLGFWLPPVAVDPAVSEQRREAAAIGLGLIYWLRSQLDGERADWEGLRRTFEKKTIIDQDEDGNPRFVERKARSSDDPNPVPNLRVSLRAAARTELRPPARDLIGDILSGSLGTEGQLLRRLRTLDRDPEPGDASADESAADVSALPSALPTAQGGPASLSALRAPVTASACAHSERTEWTIRSMTWGAAAGDPGRAQERFLQSQPHWRTLCRIRIPVRTCSCRHWLCSSVPAHSLRVVAAEERTYPTSS